MVGTSSRPALGWKLGLIGAATALVAARGLALPQAEGPLPASFSASQADRGEASYAAQCAACHGSKLEGGPGGPPLSGAAFAARWAPQSADALYGFIRDKMPLGNPGSLSPGEVAGVLAHILRTNGAKPRDAELPPDMARLARMSLAGALPAVAAPRGYLPARDESPLPPDAIAAATLRQRQAKLNALRPVTDEMLRDPPAADWIHWRGSYGAAGFAGLRQITPANVATLKPAWTRQLKAGTNEITPLVHDGVMYVASAGRLEALDAATGEQLWQYERPGGVGIARNIAIYGNLIYYAANTSVVALDMRSGKVVWDRLIAPADAGIRFGSGPIAAKGKIFQGMGNCYAPFPGGCFIVALDAASGKELWRFNTIARPGQPGGDSWNGTPVDQRYGVSVWLAGSYDPDLDLLYFGTGQTYKTGSLIAGKGRAAGLYSDSTLALRPDTGELAWHYQHMSGDVWDLDWAFERILAPMTIRGRTRPTVTTGGKLGIFDTLDAETGQYLFSNDVGLQDLITAIDPRTGEKTIDPRFAPEPDVAKSICTSALGGRDWPSTALDPRTHILYVPLNEVCMRFTWSPGPTIDWRTTLEPGSKDGVIGRVQAIDLTTYKTLWVRRERAPHSSAILATAGGLIFEGSRNQIFRASDSRTGKVLWQAHLDMPPSAFPISYAVDGEQYVAVTAGTGNPLDNNVGRLAPEIVPGAGGTTLWVFKLPGPAPR